MKRSPLPHYAPCPEEGCTVKEARYASFDGVLRCAKHMKQHNAQAQDVCEHEWEEQPGEPACDVCTSCGAVRY